LRKLLRFSKIDFGVISELSTSEAFRDLISMLHSH
jgi:hypothetical protein